MDKGFLLIVSGPSGAGKGTLVKRLIDELPDAVLSVSCTTRPPREGDVEGRDYFFLTEDEFLKRVEACEFLECAKVHEKWMYGTPSGFVEDNINAGKVVVLEIDVQGFREVMEVTIDKISVFVTPSHPDELEQRIRNRSPIDDEELKRRMRIANEEYEYIPLFDYFIVNDDLDTANANLTGVVRAEMARVSRQHKGIKKIMNLRGEESNA